MEAKIDPFFLAVIEQSTSENGNQEKKCWFRKKPKRAASKEVVSKKYECIVYTKNAQILRDKGITINSVLPTFVTAVASIAEIKMMASMSEVTYIAAPGTDHLNTSDH